MENTHLSSAVVNYRWHIRQQLTAAACFTYPSQKQFAEDVGIEVSRKGMHLSTTTIVLPLKFDKVKPVKQQLSCIHPKVLLFLSKIRHLDEIA
ncbi:hypothetical protein MTR_7g016690 [Medicago truncatula]|uniref:Uncharacterized protein n=1 Tax=Medicago truncatula TaxID=3880 RepID=G7KR24_MEDTR|nr:hypothetical protein MTR_7g016690 [Medicago truncatula]